MKSRLVASVALGLAVALGTTGCSMISPQATKIEYSPSDGVTVEGSAPLQVRNAFFVANEEGTAANLIAAVVNPTDGDLTLRMEVGDSRTSAILRVPAGSVVSLGTEDSAPLAITEFDGKPGTNVTVYFQSGSEDGIVTDVPVLDGTLPAYKDFVPAAP